MSFDFDIQLKLRGTHTSKYDHMSKAYGLDDPDLIPMWVADMDFPAAPAVLAALQAEVDRGYLGYFGDLLPVQTAVSDWYRDQHGWGVDPSHVRLTHGVISGYGVTLATCTQPGDEVIVFSPVYHAFYRQIEAMHLKVKESRLVIKDGVFHMDLDTLASQMTGREKALTLCTPHNPAGRVWTDDELRAVARFCADHDLVLISDEIHMDLTFPGVPFTPTAVAAPDCLDRLVVITAASKGFNLAGGETGLLIAPDAALRAKIDKVMADREATPNRFGAVMTKAAFAESAEWSAAVRAYIAENFRIFADRIGALPGVSVMPMQSTYLTWVDFTALGMSDAELIKRIHDAKVVPNKGTEFGTGGSGHARFNIALPRQTMLTAIERLEQAFSDLQ